MGTPEKLIELRQLAEAATKGPWTAGPGKRLMIAPPSGEQYEQSLAIDADCGSAYGLIPHGILHKNDAKYIAAVEPATVIELIDQLIRYQDETRRLMVGLRAIADQGYMSVHYSTHEEAVRFADRLVTSARKVLGGYPESDDGNETEGDPASGD